jgi:sulfur-carrier protein
MIRVILPPHLRRLANVNHEIEIQVGEPMTISSVLDELETRYPMLRGTIRDQATQHRRAFMRFFACGEDISLEPLDSRLPEPVLAGAEPLRVVGAMAGG